MQQESFLKGLIGLVKFLHLSNIAIAVLDFSVLLDFSYRSSNFAIAKLSLLIRPFASFFV